MWGMLNMFNPKFWGMVFILGHLFCVMAEAQPFDPTLNLPWTEDLTGLDELDKWVVYWTGPSALPTFSESDFRWKWVEKHFNFSELLFIRAPLPSSSGSISQIELYNPQGKLIEQWTYPIETDVWLQELHGLVQPASSWSPPRYQGEYRSIIGLGAGRWMLESAVNHLLNLEMRTPQFAILIDKDRNLRWALPWEGGDLWYSQTKDGIWYQVEELLATE